MCQTMSMSEKSKNMRNRRVSDVAAWSRTDWDEECVTTYRHVPKYRPCLRGFDSSAPSRLFQGASRTGSGEDKKRRPRAAIRILCSCRRLATGNAT